MKLTRRGLGEQHKQTDTQEDRHNRAGDLGHELVLGLGTQKMTGLQVTSHVACLSSRAGGNDTRNQVDFLRRLDRCAGTLGHTTKDELRGLGDCGHGVDIGITRRLDTNERENEAENCAQGQFSRDGACSI